MQAASNGGSTVLGQMPPLEPAMLTFACFIQFYAIQSYGVGIEGKCAKLDPRTGTEVDPRLEVEGEWWKGRTREGKES